MPSGAFVELYPFTWRRGMNVYVNLPPEDQGKTDGLCGTFDRDRSNDLKMSDGSFIQGTQHWSWYRYSYSDINRFVDSWRYAISYPGPILQYILGLPVINRLHMLQMTLLYILSLHLFVIIAIPLRCHGPFESWAVIGPLIPKQTWRTQRE